MSTRYARWAIERDPASSQTRVTVMCAVAACEDQVGVRGDWQRPALMRGDDDYPIEHHDVSIVSLIAATEDTAREAGWTFRRGQGPRCRHHKTGGR